MLVDANPKSWRKPLDFSSAAVVANPHSVAPTPDCQRSLTGALKCGSTGFGDGVILLARAAADHVGKDPNLVLNEPNHFSSLPIRAAFSYATTHRKYLCQRQSA